MNQDKSTAGCDESGASAVEYGLLVGLIAAVILATVALVGPALIPGFQSVVNGF